MLFFRCRISYFLVAYGSWNVAKLSEWTSQGTPLCGYTWRYSASALHWTTPGTVDSICSRRVLFNRCLSVHRGRIWVSVQGGLCLRGVSVWGSLSRRVSVWGGGGLCPGGSWEGLCPGGGSLCPGRPPGQRFPIW